MSHTQEIQVDLKDAAILRKAAENIDATIKEGEHKLYSETCSGTGVYLKGWKYPVVIDKGGNCKFDNYKGNWGAIDEFNKLKQQYSVEAVKAKLAQNKLKGSVSTNSNGEIVLKVKISIAV